MNKCLSLSSLIFLFAGLCAGQSWAQESQKIQTVVADGFGVDFQTAQQNAAQNALTNVVGSFIDATNLLEKRAEIREGIRSQTTNIKKDIKEYSQGTIQKIEVVEVSNEGALTRVTAKVSVRIDDFRTYIKKIAQGEVVLDQGLFAQATIAGNQRDNLNRLLIDNILKPLTDGDVIDFQVAALQPLLNINYKGGAVQIDKLLKSNSPESIFILNVRASLKPEFIQNMIQTLESVSKKRLVTPYERGTLACAKNFSAANQNLDLSFFSSDKVIFDSQSRKFTSKNQNMVGYLIEGVQQSAFKYLQNKTVPQLNVIILDGSDRTLQEDSAYPIRGAYAKGSAFSPFQGTGKERATLIFPADRDGFVLPYLFISPMYNGCLWQTTEREFQIALVIDSETLKYAKKIIIKMSL